MSLQDVFTWSGYAKHGEMNTASELFYKVLKQTDVSGVMINGYVGERRYSDAYRYFH